MTNFNATQAEKAQDRADEVRAEVSRRMQRSDEIREAMIGAITSALDSGDEPAIIAEIAHHVAESSGGVTQHYRNSHAHRLLDAMERYVRAALIEKVEGDIPQDDDEENEDE